MILPREAGGPDGRHALFRNLIRQCSASREDRKARYRRLRQLYLTGSDTGARARYNKLKEHVLYSSSYLYAPASLRFGVTLPPHYGEEWMEEVDAAREELTRLWYGSDAGLIAGMGVTWAHVYDSVVAKVYTSNNEATFSIIPDPSDIGLLHEEINDWSEQEAICHWYTLDLARFRRMIDAMPEERRNDLMAEAEQHAIPSYEATNETLPATMQRIILAQASPNMIGAAQGETDVMLAIPRVSDAVVRLAELWVKDDGIGDYRVVTLMQATEQVLWEPVNPLLYGQHPFFPLSLNWIPGYAWGECPMEDLLVLQQWRERKMNEVDARDELQLDPPLFFENMTSIRDEQAKAFRRPGGNLTSNQPGAKATPITPPPLPDPFGMVDHIDNDFARMGGLPKGATPQQDASMRSGDQVMAQALLSAGPTMVRAMLVEDWLESLATAMLRLHRRVLGSTIKKDNQSASEFLLSQMPGDIEARVWAHSASPLYAQQILAKVQMAKQAGAIDNEDFLEFLDLPMTEVKLKAKAKKLAQAQAEKQERLLRVQEAKAEAKALKK